MLWDNWPDLHSCQLVVRMYVNYTIPCFSGCLQTCNAMQLQSCDQTQAIIGQFGHVTASASCKQPEKHGTLTTELAVHCDNQPAN